MIWTAFSFVDWAFVTASIRSPLVKAVEAMFRSWAADILRTQVIPNFGKYEFDDLEPLQIEKWKRDRLTRVSEGTVKKELDTLSNVFRVARKTYRFTKVNPVDDVERPTVPKKKTRIPSAVEIQRFFEVASQMYPHHFPILLTIYLTGARIDEARHLEPTDALLADDKLAYRVKDGWSPKDAQDRDAPLVEPLRLVVRNVLKEHAGGKWLFMRADGKTIYCKRCGRRERHFGNLKKTIRAIAAAAQISQRTSHHIFRHCSNTHSQQLGAKQSAAMELLGQQTTTVNRLYTHTEWPEVVDAAQNLGRSVGQGVLALWLAQRHSDDESPSEAIESKRVPR
jgi:integrase